MQLSCLKDKYTNEKEALVDWVCIFTHSNKELKELNNGAKLIGEIIEKTESGSIYKLTDSPNTEAGKPKLLKIRISDVTKTERGDADFTTNYEKLKKEYLGKEHFKLIKREKFEMLELMDSDFDVRVYFSSIPPSKLRGL